MKTITCTACPLGCEISVAMEDGKITDISGYTCHRGEAYARAEATDPRRTLTTTVRVQGGGSPLVPVKSQKPLPRGMLFDGMKEIKRAAVKAPVGIGDVIIKNILGTGIDIVATGRAESV